MSFLPAQIVSQCHLRECKKTIMLIFLILLLKIEGPLFSQNRKLSNQVLIQCSFSLRQMKPQDSKLSKEVIVLIPLLCMNLVLKWIQSRRLDLRLKS